MMRESRFGKYFTRTGWAHILLLLAAWMFVFPFVWMFATSIKTDEELMEPGVLPPIEHFRSSSPYVRKTNEPIKPIDGNGCEMERSPADAEKRRQ